MHSGLCCMLKIVYWPQPSSDNDNCYTEYFMFWPVALLMLLQQLLTLMYLMWLLRRISLMLALMVLQGKTFSLKHLLCVLFLSWFLWCLWSILCLTYMLPFSWYVWELYYVFLCLAIFLLWSVSFVFLVDHGCFLGNWQKCYWLIVSRMIVTAPWLRQVYLTIVTRAPIDNTLISSRFLFFVFNLLWRLGIHWLFA